MLRPYKGRISFDELFAWNRAKRRATAGSVGFAQRLQIDSELLALLIKMAAL
jgi:hypothetical protein